MPLLQPDVIKLDMRLVQQHPNADVGQIAGAVQAQTEATGATVLAEGIEGEEHLFMAQALGATLAQGFLFGAPKVPHAPVVDLDLREKLILGAIIVAIFWLGLFPNEPLSKTELAAQEYRQLVSTSRLPEVPR